MNRSHVQIPASIALMNISHILSSPFILLSLCAGCVIIVPFVPARIPYLMLARTVLGILNRATDRAIYALALRAGMRILHLCGQSGMQGDGCGCVLNFRNE